MKKIQISVAPETAEAIAAYREGEKLTWAEYVERAHAALTAPAGVSAPPTQEEPLFGSSTEMTMLFNELWKLVRRLEARQGPAFMFREVEEAMARAGAFMPRELRLGLYRKLVNPKGFPED